MSRSVLAVVLAYNEERALPNLLSELKTTCPDWDVVVVNDGSTDATSSVARASGAKVLELPFNSGVAAAEQTGFLYARHRCHDVVVRLDGDGQHPPSEARRVVAALEDSGADLVIGSRFQASDGYRSTALRRAGIRWLSLLLRALGGLRVSDPTSGLRAFSSRAFTFLSEVYPEGYPEPESLLLLARSGFRLMEVPVVMRQRFEGESTLGAQQTFLYPLKVTFALLVEALRRRGS